MSAKQLGSVLFWRKSFILQRLYFEEVSPAAKDARPSFDYLVVFRCQPQRCLSFPQRFRSRFNRSSRFVKVINAGVVQQKAPLQRPVYLALSS